MTRRSPAFVRSDASIALRGVRGSAGTDPLLAAFEGQCGHGTVSTSVDDLDDVERR